VSGSARRYVAHGYAVESDIGLSLPRAPAEATGPADLVLSGGSRRGVPREPGRGELLALLETEGETHYAMTRDTTGVTMRFGGCVEFAADPGLRRVRYHRDPGHPDGLVSVLASGTLLAVRLLLDRELVLHASALDLGGRAVAFCGAPGLGKSTLATLLSQAGMPLVTDDVLRVTFSARKATAWPGTTESRLRDGGAAIADGLDPATVRATADGRRAVTPPALCHGPLPLAAVMIPLPTRGLDRPTADVLSGADALLSLVRFPRVIGWRDGPTSSAQFQLLGELVERVPVAHVAVPWGPPFPPDLADSLRDAVDRVAAATRAHR
jgi:hypothetical protein